MPLMRKFPNLTRFLSALALTGCLMITGCGVSSARQKAEAVVARHFQQISTNGYVAALADYGDAFFARTSKDDWTRVLTRVADRLGSLEGYQVSSWNVNQTTGSTGSGTYVVLVCDSRYAHHSAQEQFTLYRGAGDAAFKIVGHHINSDALADK